MTGKILVIYKDKQEKDCFVRQFKYQEKLIFVSERKIDYILEKKLNCQSLVIFISYHLFLKIKSYLEKINCIQYYLFYLSSEGNLVFYLLKEVNPLLNNCKSILSVHSNGSTYHIKIINILYVSSENLKVIIHTKEKDITIYEKLSIIEHQLPTQLFIRVHQSFLINKNFVTKVKRYQIQLMETISIPVSKRYSREVREILEYLR